MGKSKRVGDPNSDLELEEGDLGHLSSAEKRFVGRSCDTEALMRSGPRVVGRLPRQSAATLFGRGYKGVIGVLPKK